MRVCLAFYVGTADLGFELGPSGLHHNHSSIEASPHCPNSSDLGIFKNRESQQRATDVEVYIVSVCVEIM